MLDARRTARFKKEFALAERRGRDMSRVIAIMEMLVNERPLPAERKDHPLHGEYDGSRECHIQGDWVLVYKIYPEARQIVFDRTGTHSDLF